MPRRSWIAFAAAVLSLGFAPGALADTAKSSNWAGYAIHRASVRFTRVIGRWRQPSARCVAGQQTYSSVWVGLGGYSESSRALEQIGSEVDCSARGKPVSTAWYELVPAASRTIRMKVVAGDHLSASVGVVGHEVSLILRDLTRRHTFTRRVRASAVDTASAEWIVEAPSECSSSLACQTLSLADFGSATFSHASAGTTVGHLGTISDRTWGVSRITLASRGRHFIGQGASGASASASPSSLTARGSSFSVTYRGGSARVSPAFARGQSRARAGSIVRAPLARR